MLWYYNSIFDCKIYSYHVTITSNVIRQQQIFQKWMGAHFSNLLHHFLAVFVFKILLYSNDVDETLTHFVYFRISILWMNVSHSSLLTPITRPYRTPTRRISHRTVQLSRYGGLYISSKPLGLPGKLSHRISGKNPNSLCFSASFTYNTHTIQYNPFTF